MSRKLLYIVVILIVGLGFWVGYRSKMAREAGPVSAENLLEESPPTTTQRELVPTGDIKLPYHSDYRHLDQVPALSWRTYTNSIHGYSVRYPSNWVIDSSRANEVNDYNSGITANPVLKLSNGEVSWEFMIGVTAAGDGPMCDQPVGDNTDMCGMESENMRVLDEPVKRILAWSAKSGELVWGEVQGLQTRGFGRAGIKTDYVSEDTSIYWIWYNNKTENWDRPDGTFEFNKNIETLDQITRSLQFSK